MTTAASNLRQTGVAMDMSYAKYGTYPAYRSDLVQPSSRFSSIRKSWGTRSPTSRSRARR